MAVVGKLLNVLDDFKREGLGTEVDFLLPAEQVARSLNQIIEWRGKPCCHASTTIRRSVAADHRQWPTHDKSKPCKPISRSQQALKEGWMSKLDKIFAIVMRMAGMRPENLAGYEFHRERRDGDMS